MKPIIAIIPTLRLDAVKEAYADLKSPLHRELMPRLRGNERPKTGGIRGRDTDQSAPQSSNCKSAST